TSTGGIRARLRRVAGCAIPSGSAGHAGETANLKLTFHLDHSEGADHLFYHSLSALNNNDFYFELRVMQSMIAISIYRLGWGDPNSPPDSQPKVLRKFCEKF